MQQFTINTESSPSAQAGQLLSFAHRQVPEINEKPFCDNFEYLDALEKEALLILAKAVMRGRRKNPQEDTKYKKIIAMTGISGTEAKEKTWDDILMDIQQQNQSRENASLHTDVKLFFPVFCRENGLDEFDRNIVLLLLMLSTSDKCREMLAFGELEKELQKEEGLRIGTILSILYPDYRRQLLCRKHFSMEAPLIKQEIIHLDYFDDKTSNILEQRICLNERYVRHLIGDNNMYSQYSKHITRERSSVSLKQVVMPGNMKEELVLHVGKYLRNRSNGESTQLDNFYGYGTALALLFHGPSGTGKTMMAKALAAHFDSQLLMVRFDDGQRWNYEEIMNTAFQEAMLNKGFVFFDEADDLFENGSSLARSLLLKIEKARCVVILATNKPVDLDPAMERRLSMKVYFPMPDANQRLNLWKALMPDFVSLAPDVDLEYLADRYLFSGGLIKNSIFMAINAVSKDNASLTNLCQKQLVHAADLQSVSMVDMGEFCRSYTPQRKINELPLGRHPLDELRNIARVYHLLQKEGLGLNVLISASHLETGIHAAEALAAECNMMVKSYNYHDVSSTDKESRVIDPITQKKITRMDYAFKPIPGDSSLTLFVDHERLIQWKQAEENNKISISSSRVSLQNHLRLHNGLFCMVVHQGQYNALPVEFHVHLKLEYPPEEMQMQQWENKLSSIPVNDVDLVELVEHYPMHIEEIDFITKRALIQSIIEGQSPHPSLDTVKSVIARYRSRNEMPLLFGKK